MDFGNLAHTFFKFQVLIHRTFFSKTWSSLLRFVQVYRAFQSH